jgi:hypothetical protein
MTFEEPNEYTVKLVDGWVFERGEKALHLLCRTDNYTNCTYNPGTKATLKESLTTDGFTGLHIYTGEMALAILKNGMAEAKKVGTFEAANNTGWKYLETTQEDAALGPPKGTRIFSYTFGDSPKVVMVQWMVEPGSKDNTDLVEQMLKTLTL